MSDTEQLSEGESDALSLPRLLYVLFAIWVLSPFVLIGEILGRERRVTRDRFVATVFGTLLWVFIIGAVVISYV